MIRAIRQIPAEQFNRRCAIAALLFLVLSIGGRYALSGFSRQDFSQYYMGGVIARLGAWEALYPLPVPGSPLNVGYIEGSTMKPRYAQEAAARGVGDEPRFIQPPPVALLFVPLSFLSYSQAHVVWMTMLIGCTWAICLQTARIYTLCRGEASHLAGVLMLLIACSPAAHRWIRVQNVSPIVGAMIGAAMIALIEPRRAGGDVRGALALWLGALMKFATLVLLPMYIVTRRWKALAIFIAVSIASIIVSMWIMGRGPFDAYRTVVAPTLAHTNVLPQNQALMGLIARVTNENPLPARWMIAVNVARVATLIVVIVLIVGKRQAVWRSAPHTCAGGAALVCWMLMFSPMFWEHYCAYLAPLFGWTAWEATRSRGRFVCAALIVSMIYVPTTLVAKRLPDPLKAHMLASTVLMFALAIARLIRRESIAPTVDPAAR